MQRPTIAHSLPFGENNTPLPPGRAKRFGVHVQHRDPFDGLTVEPEIIKVAVK